MTSDAKAGVPNSQNADQSEILAGYREPDITAEHVFSGGGMCVNSAVRSLIPGCRLVGRALTVRTAPGWSRRPLEALALAKPGDVLVIDAGGDSQVASWGGMVSWNAARKGLAGVVIDGMTRDIVEIRRLDPPLPLFARGQVPAIAGFGPPSSGFIGQPIVCGGVPVRTGDLVFGDDDGVVVVPWEHAEEVLDLARKSVIFDQKEMQWVEDGGTVYEMLCGLWDPDGTDYKNRKFRWVDGTLELKRNR